MKRLSLIVSVLLAVALCLQFGASSAWAARKRVDCAKVMSELNAGKKVSQTAKDLKISRSSVYRCRKKAKKEAAEAKKAEKTAKTAKPAAGSGKKN